MAAGSRGVLVGLAVAAVVAVLAVLLLGRPSKAAYTPMTATTLSTRLLTQPICYLPLAMVGLALVGTLWSEASWSVRLQAVSPTLKLLMLPGLFWHWVALALFILACMTDWFDGYVARRLDQVSPLGRFLDPIADKLVVAAVLLILVSVRHIDGWAILAALIILCREILVSGLREFLAELRVGVPVSMLAKWKTAVQMIALGFLIVARPASELPINAMLIGEILLWLAAGLTLITGYDYMMIGLKHMAAQQPANPPAGGSHDAR